MFGVRHDASESESRSFFTSRTNVRQKSMAEAEEEEGVRAGRIRSVHQKEKA